MHTNVELHAYIHDTSFWIPCAICSARNGIGIHPIHLLVANSPITMYAITISIWAWEITDIRRMHEQQISKLILDIGGLDCAPSVPIPHLIHVRHGTTIYTWNSHWYMGQYKQRCHYQSSIVSISWTSIFFKRKVARTDVYMPLLMHALTIFKHEKHGRGCRGGHV